MAEPALVGDCVAAMKAAVAIPVTVKCRIGIDDQDPEVALDAMARTVESGRRRCADRACAQGVALRPVAAREPRYPAARLRHRVSGSRPRIRICRSSSTAASTSVEAAREHLAQARWRDDGPRRLSGAVAAARRSTRCCSASRAVRLAEGRRAGADSLHRARTVARRRGCIPSRAICTALFQAVPGARAYRRHLATAAVKPGACAEVLAEALALVVDRPREVAQTAAA